jgi:hypothetical protein
MTQNVAPEMVTEVSRASSRGDCSQHFQGGIGERPFADKRTDFERQPCSTILFLGDEIDNIKIIFAILGLQWVFFGHRVQRKI